MAPNTISQNPDDLDNEELDLGDEVEVGSDEGDVEVETQQAAAPEQQELAEKTGKPPATIPYNRFAEVNEQRKTAEQAAQAERVARIRLEEQLRLAQQQPAAPAKTEAEAPKVDTKALIKERNAAILEGDDDKVAEIEDRLEAERLRQAEDRAFARLSAERAKDQAKAAGDDLQRTAQEIVAAYPFLDSNSADADPDAIEDVKDLRDVYIQRGLAPAEALRKAVARFKTGFDARTGGDDALPDPAAAAAAKAAGSKVRNAKAANAQPPGMVAGMSAGAVPSLPDVDKMSVDEWSSLPQTERDKLLV